MNKLGAAETEPYAINKRTQNGREELEKSKNIAHISFNYTVNVYGTLMLLSHTLQQLAQCHYVSVRLSGTQGAFCSSEAELC